MKSQVSIFSPEMILEHFYPDNTPLRRLLLKHCEQVKDKALEILHFSEISMDAGLVSCGAMLHDIGIYRCHAPSILCEGSEPYIAHGIIGADMLRTFGADNKLDLEPYARICERHTGSGITIDDIKKQSLPIPLADYLPESPEEKLVCIADKFFSKSGDMQEKSVDEIRRSMLKFGDKSALRFDDLLRFFKMA